MRLHGRQSPGQAQRCRRQRLFQGLHWSYTGKCVAMLENAELAGGVRSKGDGLLVPGVLVQPS